MKITCGFCEEHSDFNIEMHECSDQEYFAQDLDFLRSRGNGMSYSTLSRAKAEAFLKEHPEFIETSTERDVNAYQRVAVGLSAEQQDYLTPVNYESDSELPIAFEFANAELTREDEWDGIYSLREFDAVLQGIAPWRDVEPNRCTTAYHWWRNDRRVNLMPEGWLPKDFTTLEQYAQKYEGLDFEALDFENKELMRLEFSDLQGFASELLIDADITEKFQFKVFNAYVGRDDKFHIGLLTFDRQDERIAVTCKFSGCHYGNEPYLSPENPTREEMETFVTNCIRHGNNHGPNWLITRKDFTFIHGSSCDTQHSVKEPCNFNTERTDVNRLDASDVQAVFHYLIQHRKFCRNDQCRCTHYYHLLNEVVTDNFAQVRSAA